MRQISTYYAAAKRKSHHSQRVINEGGVQAGAHVVVDEESQVGHELAVKVLAELNEPEINQTPSSFVGEKRP